MIRRNRNKKAAQSSGSEPFTYIHRGTTLNGDIEATGRVRVHGTIRGNLRIEGVLEVAEAGVIEGDLIEAEEVKIIGRVHASVHAKGKIEIWKNGQLEGDVKAAALDIEEGASFTGRSEMNIRVGRQGRLPPATEPESEANHEDVAAAEPATVV